MDRREGWVWMRCRREGLQEGELRSCHPAGRKWVARVVVGAEMPDPPCSVVRTNMDRELGGRSALTAGARRVLAG